MTDLKITIDQLKNYLGTGLEVMSPWTDSEKWTFHYDINVDSNNRCSINDALIIKARPICYRLSDLDKEIEVNGERFVPLNWIKDYWRGREDSDSTIDLDGFDFCIEVAQRGCSYTDERPDTNAYIFTSTIFQIYKWLFEWHFWPFGDEYFEQGLVIDKMKI